MAKTISVECIWESLHDIEVPDDWQKGDDIPIEWLEQADSSTAYLVDWKGE